MKIKSYVSGKLKNNTYMVINDDNECIIVDASAELQDIIPRIEDNKVLAVFLTHGHYDHFVNLEKILKHYNVKCYITGPELEKLYNPKYNYSPVFGLFKTCKEPRESFVILGEKEEFKLGKFNIKSFITKGHTDGSVCIDIDGTLFTGDTKFNSTYGRTDLLTGSVDDMQNSLSLIEKNYKGHDFYPGHGRPGVV